MQKIRSVIYFDSVQFMYEINREYISSTYHSRGHISNSSWRRLQRVLSDMVSRGEMTIKIELYGEGIITFERVQNEQEEV